MTEEDEKDAKEWLENWEVFHTFKPSTPKERQLTKLGFAEGRRTLREKIKADPTIGKLEVGDWPESPNY